MNPSRIWDLPRKFLNCWEYYRALQRLSPRSSQYPPSIGIETSAACNLRCPKCPVGRERKVPSAQNFIDVGLFRKIIDEVSPHIFYVGLSYFGEPLINPAFLSHVRYAKDAGLRVGFYSNGVCLTSDSIDTLLDAQVDSIAFSVDCLPNEYAFYSAMKGIPLTEAKGHLSSVVANICNLAARAKMRGCPIDIYAIRMDSPEGTPLSEYNAFWRTHGITPISGGIIDWGGTVDRIQETRRPAKHREKFRCLSPYTMSVSSDGSVGLCHIDYNAQILIGNARTQTIKQIYNSPRICEIRRQLTAGDLKGLPCIQCQYEDFAVPSGRPFVQALRNTIPPHVLTYLRRNLRHWT